MIMSDELSPHLQKLVDMGETGTNIMHGELKNWMLEAETQLINAQETENKSGEAIDSMERMYWEGQLDALTNLYTMTYNLAFAINERAKQRG
jgi:hypothetical protein